VDRHIGVNEQLGDYEECRFYPSYFRLHPCFQGCLIGTFSPSTRAGVAMPEQLNIIGIMVQNDRSTAGACMTESTAYFSRKGVKTDV
jgi:hypothetical protein